MDRGSCFAASGGQEQIAAPTAVVKLQPKGIRWKSVAALVRDLRAETQSGEKRAFVGHVKQFSSGLASLLYVTRPAHGARWNTSRSLDCLWQSDVKLRYLLMF